MNDATTGGDTDLLYGVGRIAGHFRMIPEHRSSLSVPDYRGEVETSAPYSPAAPVQRRNPTQSDRPIRWRLSPPSEKEHLMTTKANAIDPAASLTGDRARILALIDLEPTGRVSDKLRQAIAAGSTVVTFATLLAQAARTEANIRMGLDAARRNGHGQAG